MASPVLVVLNPENFEQVREKNPGGRRTDFFANRRIEFRTHKSNLIKQIDAVINTLETQPQGQIGFLKVILRRDAWAKSHRPVKMLFQYKLTPLVGGVDIGEMIFEVTPESLKKIKSRIEDAEEDTRTKLDSDGKTVNNPSTVKSETGAIYRIELYSKFDKRSFSPSDAVNWLSKSKSGGNYVIELFKKLCRGPELENLDARNRYLQESFINGLNELNQGMDIGLLSSMHQNSTLLKMRLNNSSNKAVFQLEKLATTERRVPAPFEQDVDRHTRFLVFLEQHPLVRRIDLPGVISRSDANVPAEITGTRPIELPIRNSEGDYPKVGIIDGGIAQFLDDWVIDRWELIAESDLELSHGTFIGGLLVAGTMLNGQDNCPETDGVDLFDIALLPDERNKDTFKNYFPQGVLDVLTEIEYAVEELVNEFNVRVFNLSLNVEESTAPTSYSIVAAKLDEIAEKHNVIFIISAGNLSPQESRSEWPRADTDALAILASLTNDRIKVPAESVRNVSVSALNPTGVSHCLPFAPANYSRRGPGLRTGVKPDLANVGGSGSIHGSGLYSVHPTGNVTESCGTSFSTPLVAKTASKLEQLIEGKISLETLKGLLFHHAEIPEVLRSASLKQVARHLVGYGIPPTANEILETDDHSITLLFSHVLKKEEQIEFKFNWPRSLVNAGKCKGYAKLTIVSTPLLDRDFGAEFIRVNIDARLQQKIFKDGNDGWKGRLKSICEVSELHYQKYEYDLINHAMKWSPVKIYESKFPKGVGNSSEWRLFVNYLTRLDVEYPDKGIPFTAILTIKDLEASNPVFSEMRQNLIASGVEVGDIKTAARISTRI